MFKKLYALFFLFLFCVTSAFAAHNAGTQKKDWPTVNIFQWWGYISSTDPYVKKIENECHAKISYDQYYSNNQFLRRMHNPMYQYDIIIFSDTIYKAIEKQIANNSSRLYKLSEGYYPLIKEHYAKSGLAHNVVYFVQSLSGFLYNPKNIQLSPSDDIYDMFRKAKGKTVVMLDDPVEAEFMLSLGTREAKHPYAKLNQSLSLVPLTVKNFKALYQGTNFIVTNLPEKIITKPDFAFAFQWSGDAIEMLKENNGNLKFFVHPRLSYVSSDLLAALNEKPSTVCVAEKLGSQWFLDHEQNLTDYFSPYGSSKTIKSPYLKKLQASYIKNLPTLPWIISVDASQFRKLSTEWDWIKLKIMEQDRH